MSIKTGIIGVSGYGGGEALRIIASHLQFKLTYVTGSSSAGQKLGQRYPAISNDLAELPIEEWSVELMSECDLIFASLPTGNSKEPLAQLPKTTKIVDIGGDHRYAPGWTYGMADLWPERIRESSRIANPGCYPSASLLAIAPLISAGLVDNDAPIIIDAKSGVSGAGRGSSSNPFSFAELNEDVSAYKLHKHSHVPEISATIGELGQASPKVTFTPHLIPMTRGILATCYLRGSATTEQCLAAARKTYQNRAFVRVTDAPPHTKWASGSNFAFVSYAADNGSIIAIGAIDNLGKGAAGQAVQNANLMFGLPETTGLTAMPFWP